LTIASYFIPLRNLASVPSIIEWIQTLYNDISSSTLTNGFISKPFKVTRSIRQGCGLSPSLFALCIETLANRIRQSVIIRGITLIGTEEINKILLHADDTTLLVRDGASAKEILNIFEIYSNASGSLLNVNKSQTCIIAGKPNLEHWPKDLKFSNTLKIYGVPFGKDCREILQAEIINKVRKTILNFKYPGYSLLSKAIICNLRIVSKLTYFWHTTCVGNNEIEVLKKEIFSFIWKKTEWLKRETLYLTRKEGGLDLVDLDIRYKTLKLKHIHEVINNKQAAPLKWAQIFIPVHLRNKELKIPPILLTNELYNQTLQLLKNFQQINPNFLIEKFDSKKTYQALLRDKREIPIIKQKLPLLPVEDIWEIISVSNLTSNARDLAFRISHHILPIKNRLFNLKIIRENLCPLCGKKEETLPHLFLECEVIKPIRDLVKELTTEKAKSDLANLYLLIEKGDKIETAYNLSILSEVNLIIWKKRNKKHFEKTQITSIDVLNAFKYALKDLILADKINMDTETFQLKWCGRPLPVTIDSSNNVIIGF
jgi:hypothetical protein